MDGTAHPTKVREKAGAFALKHGSSGKAAEAYEVSRASAVRWVARLRETGKIVVGKIGRHRKQFLEG